ncbi:MAG: ATP-binding cassette domain-containing protein [Myxococcota bacterium]
MIRVRDLSKEYRIPIHHRGAFGAIRNLFDPRYDVVRAVDGISFRIEPGEFVGFIGPNGAGKSTTVKVLTGVLEPTSGEVSVCGRVPRLERVSHVAHLGVVFGQRTQLWWDLPVIESYALLQHVYAIPDPAFRTQRDRLVELLDLSLLLDTPVRKLSLGQRMRCELVGALLHGPDLLFLDEPTLGLDVVAKQTIRQFLASENADRGTTILLATHDLPDIERLCPRMILIDEGRVAFDGALAELRHRLGRERRLAVDFEGEPPGELPPGVRVEERGPERLVLRFSREDIPAPQLIAWLGERRPIADLTLEDPPIEDVIARIYRTGMQGHNRALDAKQEERRGGRAPA